MKKPRDIAQARAMFNLIQERLPHLGFDQIKSMPERLRDESVMSLLSNVEEEAMGEEDTPRFRPS